MTITAGSRLGPYEIVAPIGVGGMGEVWRARDTRLERSVAIKVLPAEFAQNEQLKLRFEREAKTISQLNHPHICTLYDVGDGYLVMELLEGESLAERLAKGSMPLEQVLRYGIQIAEALEKAHKAGVVHRDLKPGNIMITKSGAKLLDFGLAKPAETGVLNALTSLRTEKRSLTEEGTIVGTFQYMAPEQLEGGDIDARTDLFALGAVLYEMATGRRAFVGKSKASLIASILTLEPQPISAVQPMTPASFDRVVRFCLAKDADERIQSAHDVKLQLQWIAEKPVDAEGRPAAKRRDVVAWSIVAILALALAAVGVVASRHLRGHAVEPPVRLQILPPEGWRFDFVGEGAPPAISPDGQKIIFGTQKDGRRVLWLRRLDSIVPQMLAGTDGASFPFWSPDSRSIAFFADNKLKTIEAVGGAPALVCDIVAGRGGSWSANGTIIFAGRYTPIFRVSAAGGGPPIPVTALDPRQRDLTHRWPQFLPDGRHFFFLASPVGSEDTNNAICVGSIDVKMRKPLFAVTSSQATYVDGHVLFVRDQTLMAHRFDTKTLSVVGDPFGLVEQGVERDTFFSRSVTSVSPAGTLVYQTGAPSAPGQLAWFDRMGKPIGTTGETATFGAIALSPDARSVVASIRTLAPPSNLWMYDLQRGVKSRLTFGPTRDTGPSVSPDGKQLLYVANAPSRIELRTRDLATGAEQMLVSSELPMGAPSWSSDGQTIAFSRVDRQTRADLWTMTLADGKAQPYLATQAVETVPRMSPDGRWMAYQSNESGRFEIYIAPIPATGAKWQVSISGGVVPHWRRDGKELYFVAIDHRVNAVPITLGNPPSIGAPQPLFLTRPAIVAPVAPVPPVVYDQTADGQKFIVNTRVGDDPLPEPIIVVQHFDNELRAAAANHR